MRHPSSGTGTLPSLAAGATGEGFGSPVLGGDSYRTCDHSRQKILAAQSDRQWQLAIMILKQDTEVKGSLAGKRKSAGWNNDTLEALLLQITTRQDAKALMEYPAT